MNGSGMLRSGGMRPGPHQKPPIDIGPSPRMAKSPSTPRELVDRLDARHDELIAKLDELNAQIETALAEFSRSRESPSAELEKRAA
jgi:hypothetical protein